MWELSSRQNDLERETELAPHSFNGRLQEEESCRQYAQHSKLVFLVPAR